ncbi:MAG: hypothetical protein WD081_07465 [Gammaproteobacteria bacterium]
MSSLTLSVRGLREPPAPLASLREHLGPTTALDRFVRADRAEPAWSLAPTAAGALTALAAGDEPGDAWWARLDPVHLVAGNDSLRMAPPTLDDDDSATLVAYLAHELDLPIFRADATHWYARFAPYDERLHAPSEVLGRNIDAYLPRDSGLLRWINEAQMVLHQHPVNQRRADHGEPAINCVWPWGGGVIEAPDAMPFTRVCTLRPELKGTARFHGLEVAAVPRTFADTPHQGDTLVELDALFEAGRLGAVETWVHALRTLVQDWLAPAVHALDADELASLILYDGQTAHTLRRGMRWRVWRRGGFLAAAH